MNYISEETLIKGNTRLTNYLPEIGVNNVKQEIISGLMQTPKFISPKFFYNEKGSKLFEQITDLEEYYPTRTEKSILKTIVQKTNIDFTGMNIIELGSGDASKIRLLLNQISDEDLSTITYVPVDISQSAIEGSANALAKEFPTLKINGIIADFIHQLDMIPKTKKRLFCFFGSTIGNLSKAEIKDFMFILGNAMQSGDSLLLGMDMVKDIETIEAAYNDKKGITEAFNLNILNVVNELSSSNFDSNNFEHLAFYNSDENRIEMHLKAKEDTIVYFANDLNSIAIKKGETIHTENSHKFNHHDIEQFAVWANLMTKQIITDKKEWFSLVHYVSK